MKLSELKGEAALDVLAELIEPAVEIMQDKELKAALEAKEMAKGIKIAIKNHKKAVIHMMAIVDGEDPETYQPGVLDLPVKLLNLLNDPDVMGLFRLPQGQENQFGSGSITIKDEA